MRLARVVLELRRRAVTRAVLGSARLRARLAGGSLRVEAHPTAVVERGVRISMHSRTANTIRLGPGAVVEGGATILLKGGTFDFGRGCRMRHGAVVNLSGLLECEGRNVLSWGVVVHCAEHVRIGDMTGIGDHASIIDSTHHHDGEHEWYYENTSSAPITIGRNTWVGAKSTITMGVTVGDCAVIASNAVVTRDVDDAVVVGGVPAKVLAPRAVGRR